MSDNGVPIETIADLAGHASTAVPEEVYRRRLNRVITTGATTGATTAATTPRLAPSGPREIEKRLRSDLRNPF